MTLRLKDIMFWQATHYLMDWKLKYKYCVQLMRGIYLEILSTKQRSACAMTANSNWDKILKYVNTFAFNQMTQMMSMVSRIHPFFPDDNVNLLEPELFFWF